MPVYHRYIQTQGHWDEDVEEILVIICAPISDEPDNQYLQRHGIVGRSHVVPDVEGNIDRHTAACSKVIKQYPAYSLSSIVIERVDLASNDQFGIIMPLELT